MTSQEILKHIDHTLLAADASWQQIKKVCEEAVTYHTASACIPPSYIARAHREWGDALNICTVIGFPLGYSVKEAKLAEAERAMADGAREVDMVVNLGDVKNGDFEKVQGEIAAIKRVMGAGVLKVILETCYLTRGEKIALCQVVTEAGADYVKTSTGFGSKGAVLEDIALFREWIGPKVKIKAAGGIRTLEDIELFLAAGCERIGSSAAVRLLAEKKS